jgi:hypothetical protein
VKLFFGGFQLGDMNASNIAPRRTLLKNAAGIGIGFEYEYTANCSFTVTGQADCKTKMDAVEAALKKEAVDLFFYNDDGTATTNSQTTATTLNGVRCVNLVWDPTPGGQFATWRAFSCTFTWIIKFVNTGSPSYTAPLLVDFDETVMLDNPLPGYVVLEAINDVPPKAFFTVQQPKATGTQTGFAVGLSARAGVNPYPLPAVPLFNTTPPLKKHPLTYKTPERQGDQYWKYRIEWRYEYDSPVPLIAVPTLWT